MVRSRPATSPSSAPMARAAVVFHLVDRLRLGVGAPSRVQWVPATSSTTAAATFDLAGVNAGSYAVVVTNRGGCSAGVDGAFLVE